VDIRCLGENAIETELQAKVLTDTPHDGTADFLQNFGLEIVE
jgi:hypothetical protein